MHFLLIASNIQLLKPLVTMMIQMINDWLWEPSSSALPSSSPCNERKFYGARFSANNATQERLRRTLPLLSFISKKQNAVRGHFHTDHSASAHRTASNRGVVSEWVRRPFQRLAKKSGTVLLAFHLHKGKTMRQNLLSLENRVNYACTPTDKYGAHENTTTSSK